MWRLHTWLTLLILHVRAGPVTSEMFQQQYEQVDYGRLAQYAEDIAFSLVSFTIPLHTLKAEFLVTLKDGPTNHDHRTVLLSLRKQAIPVLQAYKERVPEFFVLPSDQQVYETKNETNVTLILNSPTPGRLYLVGTELNTLTDVVDYLRWGQEMVGRTEMSVTAAYTMRPSVTSVSVDDVNTISSAAGSTQIYSFRVPGFTMLFSILVSNCQHNSSSGCPVTMVTADSLAKEDNSSVSIDCSQKGPQCQLNVPSPLLEQDHYVMFYFDNPGKDNITFDISFDVQGCAVEAVQYTESRWTPGNSLSLTMLWTENSPQNKADISYNPHVSSSASRVVAPPVSPSDYRDRTGIGPVTAGPGAQHPLCLNLGYLGRNSYASKETSFAFHAEFGTWGSDGEIIPDFNVVVPDFTTEVRSFSLQETLDSGGVLHVLADLRNKTWQGMIWVCAMPRRLPINGSVDSCPDGALLMLNASTADNGTDQPVFSHAYLPFPKSGWWYLAMQSQCSSEPCDTLPMVQLSVTLEQCPPDNCGQYGNCQMFTDANLVFSCCSCEAGYRGLAFNDDTYKLTDSEQLRAVYLLTLSNLAFVPAICLALYRRYFTLAAIFFFNAFFSAFYHACDTSSVFQKCIMDYGTLAFCDFLGSMLSFYSILLYMARIPDHCRSFLLTIGVLVIAVFQNSDRHNDLFHIMPLVVVGVVLIISWALVMRARRQLFPSKRRYLFYLLPGVVLALTGIAVNYGLMGNKSTYQYTHSFWHLSLMISPCFLMPPRSKGGAGNKGLSISAQDIIRSGHSDQIPGQQEEDEAAMFDASMNSINGGQNRLI